MSANCEDSIAAEGAARVRALARGNDRAREQYIDIFSGRAFREALIVHGARAGAIRRENPRDRLDAFHFVAPLNLAVRPPAEGESVWRAGDGEEGIAVEDQATAEAIRRLIARLPRSSRLDDVAPKGVTEPRLRARIADALARLVAFGHCAISTEPVICATRLAERPAASRLAAGDALIGEATANLRHASVRLEPLQRLFLPLLDGTRTRDDLVAHALDLAERVALNISGPGGRIEGRDNLLRLALLEGD